MKELRTSASEFHKKVYNIVKECYPEETLLNEEPIKVSGKVLYLDIYIPRLKIAIECDGIQHDKFSKFYHGDATNFLMQKKNDKLKNEFCQLNNIALVRVSYKDKLNKDFLTDKILEAMRN